MVIDDWNTHHDSSKIIGDSWKEYWFAPFEIELLIHSSNLFSKTLKFIKPTHNIPAHKEWKNRKSYCKCYGCTAAEYFSFAVPSHLKELKLAYML